VLIPDSNPVHLESFADDFGTGALIDNLVRIRRNRPKLKSAFPFPYVLATGCPEGSLARERRLCGGDFGIVDDRSWPVRERRPNQSAIRRFATHYRSVVDVRSMAA
jgi:hypothetical protein